MRRMTGNICAKRFINMAREKDRDYLKKHYEKRKNEDFY